MISAYSADNASVNYGRYNSVFQKLKENNNYILKANCVAHIVHNNAKHAGDRLNIDIENVSITNSNIFSNSDELRHSLRWIAMSSAMVSEIDYSASTGIHSGEDVVKMLLAGASAVQVCSHLYQNGVEEIANMNNFLKEWMQKKGYANISEFKGLLNYKNLEKNVAYERSQFMKYYSSHK